MKAEQVGTRKKRAACWDGGPIGCGRQTKGGIKDDDQVSGLGSGLHESEIDRGQSTGGEGFLEEGVELSFRCDESEVIGNLPMSNRILGTGVWNPSGTILEIYPV